MRTIDILDTTLRDGNYAVDFQFTGRDTEIIALALEKAGFKWIEIGHGLGLNASNCGKGVAAATDREYLEAARKSLSKAKYGMFFIPGIGRSQDIKMASDLGMSFVRVGTNADSVSEAKKYISLAKKLGMTVFSNLMKSYALTPQDLSEKAYMAEGFGADIVCIVDSAGGMLPEDVASYFNEMKKKASLRLGFHGHNNLCLAVANTLVAIECGATIVDTSLQGLGRSSGNAPTETIATILEKKNMLPKINVRETLDISEKLVRPFIHKYGISPMEVTLGYAQFHSSFMTKVNEIAEKYGVDKRELVINVSLKDRMSPSEKLIKEEARKIKEKKKSGLKKAFVIKRIHADFVDTVSPQKTTLRNVIKQISSVSRKTGKLGVLNIASSQERKNKGLWVSPFIQDSFSYIVGTAEVSDIAHMRKIAHEADGVIDYILFDTTYEIKIKGSPLNVMRKYLKETEVILYNDYRAWINTVAREICQLSGNPSGLEIAVFGDLTYTLNTALILSEAGSSVTLHVDEKEIFKEGALKPFLRKGMKLSLQTDALIASRKKNILVGFSPGRCCIMRDMAKEMRNDGIIIDAGLGSMHKDVISYAHRKNIKVIRVDMRPIIAGEITSSLGVKQLVGSHIGRKKIGGKTVVSGGFIGRKGDIVVESVKSPTKVIGIARGDGSVEYRNFGRHKKDIEKIENEILRAKVTLKD